LLTPTQHRHAMDREGKRRPLPLLAIPDGGGVAKGEGGNFQRKKAVLTKLILPKKERRKKKSSLRSPIGGGDHLHFV